MMVATVPIAISQYFPEGMFMPAGVLKAISGMYSQKSFMISSRVKKWIHTGIFQSLRNVPCVN